MTFAPIPAVAPQSVSVRDVIGTITEGDQGTQTVSFAVTADPGAGNVTMNFTTVNGTATGGPDIDPGPGVALAVGVDYLTTSGTLTFGAGGGTQFVTVTVNGDFSFEANETFFLQLTSVTGAAVADGSGVATINDNDGAPLGDTLLGSLGNDTLIGGPAADFCR